MVICHFLAIQGGNRKENTKVAMKLTMSFVEDFYGASPVLYLSHYAGVFHELYQKEYFSNKGVATVFL